MGDTSRPDSRARLYQIHLVRCAVCRGQWLKEVQGIPESKRNIELEKMVDTNHRGSNIV